MQQQDKIRSGILVRWMLLTNSRQISMKLSPCIFKPNKLLIWLQAIIRLAADVNPDTTGMETNSTRNPSRRIPRTIVTLPDKKHRRIAYSGIPLEYHKSRNINTFEHKRTVIAKATEIIWGLAFPGSKSKSQMKGYSSKVPSIFKRDSYDKRRYNIIKVGESQD